MSSLYEAAILNAWRQNGDEISFAAAKQIYSEIYFEKQKQKYPLDFMSKVLKDLQKTAANYNLNYDTRRHAERKYDKYVAMSTNEEQLASYLSDTVIHL